MLCRCSAAILDAGVMAKCGSYDAAIHLSQQTVPPSRTVDACKRWVFKQRSQVRLESCCSWWLLFGVRVRCIFADLFRFPIVVIIDGFQSVSTSSQ